MFFIKIKLKGYLKNINQNTTEIIDVNAIKNKNTINYKINDILHKITIKNNKLFLSRNNNEYSYELIFELNKETNTEYYIKELNTSIDIRIKTTKLLIKDNKIEINYTVIDSDEKYLYLIEMSD